MDFTLTTYKRLIQSFLDKGYAIQAFEDFLGHPADGKVLILRHDVDELAYNALKMARLEHQLGVRSTYFFRIVKQSNVPEVIEEIKELGHEIGYHYEDLVLASGDFDKAMDTFRKNLEYFRHFYPVKTICMHGSSSSKYDNRDLWNRYSFSDFGILGEPYISVDFGNVYYISDTGRCWDGFAVRDVVENKIKLKFHTSDQIIQSVEKGNFPEKAMLLAHTLWTDNMFMWIFLWMKETTHNIVKRYSQKSKLVKFFYESLAKLFR